MTLLDRIELINYRADLALDRLLEKIRYRADFDHHILDEMAEQLVVAREARDGARVLASLADQTDDVEGLLDIFVSRFDLAGLDGLEEPLSVEEEARAKQLDEEYAEHHCDEADERRAS